MRRFILWSILILTLAGTFAASAWSLRKGAPAASVTVAATEKDPRAQREGNPAPGFTGLGLTDQEGRPFDENRLKGRVWIADFIFTSCAGTCPGMSAKMAELQHHLPLDLLLVSFSVDPKRDTPAALAEYARRYGAQPGRWFLLSATGVDIQNDPELLYRFVQHGFGLSASEGESPEEPIIHSVRFVLVDRAGQIRGYYDSSEPTQFEKLIRDAGSL